LEGYRRKGFGWGLLEMGGVARGGGCISVINEVVNRTPINPNCLFVIVDAILISLHHYIKEFQNLKYFNPLKQIIIFQHNA
jgi:hypothetical protein